MKRTVIQIILFLAIILGGIGYKIYSGESGGADVAQKIVDNYNDGGAITYTESYNTADGSGVYTYSRDAEGNAMVSNLGKNITEDYTYDVVDYKIGDKYYARIEGVNYEYGTEEIKQFDGYDGYDIATMFVDEEAYVTDTLKHYSVNLFDADKDADFKKEGDKYVSSGTYEEGGDFRVELAKDGSSLTIVDDEATVKVTFDTEAIALPQ